MTRTDILFFANGNREAGSLTFGVQMAYVHAFMERVMDSRQDSGALVKEPSDERMHFRIKKRVKQTIHQAATLAGMDDSSFVISAAYDAAVKAIEAHAQTVIRDIDFEPFFAALDNPPAPTAALVDAFKRRRDIMR